MYQPPYIVFDVETALTDGTPSVDYYREDFRVVSAAFAWRGPTGDLRTLFLEGEEAVRAQLERVASPLVVHNFQFEYGVTAHRFPGLEGRITHDTMRLVQVADNGGKAAAYQPKVETYDDLLDLVDSGGDPSRSTTGLGLVAAASRWLPAEHQNHKEPYHAWLRENAGVRKGHEGAHLTSLPPDMLEAYNVADAVVTLHLYETLVVAMAADGYDWSLDHELYKSTARMVAMAKGVGAQVDVPALQAYAAQVEQEVADIEAAFRTRFAAELARIEGARVETYIQGLKTPKGQARRREELAQDDSPIRFNVGSGKQLKELFVDTLGIQPRFWTKAPKGRKKDAPEFVPSPSFKAAHLSTYGDGGALLIKRRKRLLVLQQTRALLALAAHDGRWHFDLRACGTATGRMAGGRHD